MKTIIKPLISLIACLGIIGCSGIPDNGVKEFKGSLKGTVYGLSDTVDASCLGIPTGTDYYPQYVFVDDNMFVGTIFNCCMPTTITYLSGSYKIKGNQLFLSYNPTYVEYTLPVEEDTTHKIQGIPEKIEEGKADITKEEWTLVECDKRPYFKMNQEPWGGGKMAYSKEKASKILDMMKAKGISKFINVH